jgi:hypothetical protein
MIPPIHTHLPPSSLSPPLESTPTSRSWTPHEPLLPQGNHKYSLLPLGLTPSITRSPPHSGGLCSGTTNVSTACRTAHNLPSAYSSHTPRPSFPHPSLHVDTTQSAPPRTSPSPIITPTHTLPSHTSPTLHPSPSTSFNHTDHLHSTHTPLLHSFSSSFKPPLDAGTTPPVHHRRDTVVSFVRGSI